MYFIVLRGKFSLFYSLFKEADTCHSIIFNNSFFLMTFKAMCDFFLPHQYIVKQRGIGKKENINWEILFALSTPNFQSWNFHKCLTGSVRILVVEGLKSCMLLCWHFFHVGFISTWCVRNGGRVKSIMQTRICSHIMQF